MSCYNYQLYHCCLLFNQKILSQEQSSEIDQTFRSSAEFHHEDDNITEDFSTDIKLHLLNCTDIVIGSVKGMQAYNYLGSGLEQCGTASSENV